jgi:hypothetical protein
VDLFPQLVYPVHPDKLNPDWTKLHGWSRSHQGDGGGKIIIFINFEQNISKKLCLLGSFALQERG